jgi:hypothetical protein
MARRFSHSIDKKLLYFISIISEKQRMSMDVVADNLLYININKNENTEVKFI